MSMLSMAYSTSAWSFSVQRRIPTGGGIAFAHHVFAIPSDIGVELANVFVSEAVDFDFDQHMAFEGAVVEDEIHEAAGFADDDAFLLGFEAESVAEFHKEFPEVLDERGFEVGLGDSVLGAQAKEFKNVGIADGEGGFGGL